MKFNVIIGNPPYQQNDGGGHGDSSKPIYNKFIENAKKIKPNFISFIVPSRWMKGGKGLDKFRKEMINDNRIKIIHDHQSSKDIFLNVHIDGGVCYFLWDKNYNGLVNYNFYSESGYKGTQQRSLSSSFSSTVIRDNRCYSLIEKVSINESFSNIVLPRNPFGINADLFNNIDFYKDFFNDEITDSYKIYGVKGKKGGSKRVSDYIFKNKINKNLDYAESYNIFFSKAFSTNAINPPKSIIANKDEICTETFLCIGKFKNKEELLNCKEYMDTIFFKVLLYLNRSSINISKKSFEYIPLLNFEESWNDEKLFKYFKLESSEIDYIKSVAGIL